MFDHYDETARRAVFFARYEAANFGSREIDTHHLLLGVLRAEPSLMDCVAGQDGPEGLREEFAPLRAAGKPGATVDLPLSRDLRRVLALALEESRLDRSKLVHAGHLLAALAQDPGAAGEALRRRGIDVQVCREKILPGTTASLRVQLGRLVDELPDHRLEMAVKFMEALVRDARADDVP